MITSRVACEIEEFTSSLDSAYRRMVDGIFALPGGCREHPYHRVAYAIEMQNGLICPLLYAYRDGDPACVDLPFLDKISQALERLFELGKDVARHLGLILRSGVSYVKRYAFAPRRFFALDYLSGVTSRTLDPMRARERILEALSKAMRNFLAWLRDALRLLERKLSPDPNRPIVLSAAAQREVMSVSRREGLLVLRPVAREGSQPFHILPTSKKAWEVLRKLCEEGDGEGYVALPRDYASAFHHTDAGNNSLDDDYARLLRHIVPGPTGAYRLSAIAKPRLLRGQ